jgi:hypothetical protein
MNIAFAVDNVTTRPSVCEETVGGASRGDYAQDKVRPGTGREDALGYVRYIAIEHMEVRRDCSRFALCLKFAARRASHSHSSNIQMLCRGDAA